MLNFIQDFRLKFAAGHQHQANFPQATSYIFASHEAEAETLGTKQQNKILRINNLR